MTEAQKVKGYVLHIPVWLLAEMVADGNEDTPSDLLAEWILVWLEPDGGYNNYSTYDKATMMASDIKDAMVTSGYLYAHPGFIFHFGKMVEFEVDVALKLKE